MKKIFLWLLFIPSLFISCKKLEQLPQSSASRSAVFGSEKGLETYANSFYSILPNANNIFTADNVSDYTARRDVPRFLRAGAYAPNIFDNTILSGANTCPFCPAISCLFSKYS